MQFQNIVNINDIYYMYCPSNNKKDIDRKPNTGMLDYFYTYHVQKKYQREDCLMVGDASGLPGQFSDSDKKTAENFGIDYLDIDDFVKVYS